MAPQDRDWDILLTAETHNFPCAVAPYPGTLPLPPPHSLYLLALPKCMMCAWGSQLSLHRSLVWHGD